MKSWKIASLYEKAMMQKNDEIQHGLKRESKEQTKSNIQFPRGLICQFKHSIVKRGVPYYYYSILVVPEQLH